MMLHYQCADIVLKSVQKFVEKVGKIPKMFQKASNGDNKIVNELIHPTCSRISNLGDMFDIEYERTNAQVRVRLRLSLNC